MGPLLLIKEVSYMNVKETIKDAAFHFYGMLFSVAAKLPVKENRVVLFSLHDANFTDGDRKSVV